MNNKNFWNNVAKRELTIGIIMGASRILEYGLMLSGDMKLFALLSLEWIVVAVLFSVMLYRVVKCRAEEIYESAGISFSHMLNYAMIISVFASVIVAAMSYVYINSVAGGYENYISNMVASAVKVMDEAQIENSIMTMYRESFAALQSGDMQTPTIVDTFLSAMSTYILAGVAVGAVASLVIKRKLQKNHSNEQ